MGRSAAKAISDDTTWTKLASLAVDRGDFKSAKAYFERAIEEEPRSPLRRFHLAIVLEALSEFGPAGEQLTEALRLQPTMLDAARRLGGLVTRRSLPASVKLNPRGIQAALNFEVVNRDQIAEAFIYSMSRSGPLRDALEHGRAEGWHAAARELCLKKTGDLLHDELFRTALSKNIIRMPELEHLLAGIRRVILLELPRERLEDRALVAFLIALAQQCWINEYVWFAGEDEEEAVRDRLFGIDYTSGDVEAGLKLAVAATYSPITSLIAADADVSLVRKIKPHVVRDFALERWSAGQAEKTYASLVPTLSRISDSTSMAVRSQYEAAPYPRWTSLGVTIGEAEWRGLLHQFFEPERLQFLNRPFEVLVAGCGTGLQALAAATVYGPNARVTAIDISRSSLAYASRMAEHLKVGNVRFIQADILELKEASDFAKRFDVIECVGVLHHMADPYKGWNALMQCLSSGGIMLLGLYSRTARRFLEDIRSLPDYPGPACSDRDLRKFRQTLISRPGGRLRDEYFGIRDLYSASSFRDLFLHVNEKTHTLPEIASYIGANDIRFRGFMNLQDFAPVKDAFPAAEWPGELSQWAEIEKKNPMLFGDMYRFWCDKVK